MTFSRLKKIFLIAICASVSACSLFDDDEPEPADLVDFEQTADLDRVWWNRVGDQGDEELFIRLMPVINGDVIYAASVDGDVTAIDRKTGGDIWDIDTDENLVSAVGVGNDLVFVGTINGVLIALKQTDGEEIWRKALSSEMLSAAVADKNSVVAQTIDGKVVGLDVITGEQRWQYNAAIPSLTLRGSASPIIESGVAYIAFANGKVVALDATNGLQLWERQVTLPEGRTELERIIDFDGRPVLSGNDLYVASFQGRATLLEKNKGVIQWSEKISTIGQITLGNGNLYLTRSDDTVVAIKMATGRVLWENSQLAHRWITSPAVIGDYVAVADFDGYIHLLNQSDGQFAARYSLWCSDGVRNALFSDGETLYVLSNSGKITALALDND